MPQCLSEMVQVSNFYLQRGAAKILNKALLKFGRKPKRCLMPMPMSVSAKASVNIPQICFTVLITEILSLCLLYGTKTIKVPFPLCHKGPY